MSSGLAPVGEFTQAGSVVRLKFRNFMQYSDTEFKLGPNLNVIIGPNGSGKSTIVNGICLGLAGKTSVLGRANSIVDFIKLGEQETEVETELYQPDDDNTVIVRKWGMDGKSVWGVNGRKVTQKEVEKIIAGLRIQVGNLCQFLPQDKVHDFSRLNSKGLLDSTVDAVGEVDLKEKHAELKELQKQANEGEDLYDRKKQMLKEQTKKCDRLEEDVKAFNEKKKIEKVIELLAKKQKWALYNEVKKDCSGKLTNQKEAKRKWEEQEVKMKPLNKAVNDAKRKKEDMDEKLKTDNTKIKDCMAQSKFHSQNIEKLEVKVEEVEETLDDIDQKEKERLDEIKRLEVIIAELEAEFEGTEDDNTLGPQLDQAKKQTRQLETRLQELLQQKDNLKFGKIDAARKVKETENQLRDLENVDRQKLEILKGKNMDAYKAVLWLRENKNRYRGAVFEPFILCGNVANPENAKYLEANIILRDMTSFFFQDPDEMIDFTRHVRNNMGLKKVAAAQLPAETLDHFRPKVPRQRLVELGVKGYLTEMVSAPDEVMAFMCKQFNLHNTPVFPPTSEKHNDRLIAMDLRKFYFGTKCQAISGSRYSDHKTTKTSEIRPQRTLEVSMDMERARMLTQQLGQLKGTLEQLEEQSSQYDQTLGDKNREVEAARQTQKELEQKKNFRQRQEAKINQQKLSLRKALAIKGNEEEKKRVEGSRKKMIRDMVKAADKLKVSISEGTKARLTMDRNRLVASPLQEVIDQKQAALNTAVEAVEELRTNLNQCTQILDEAKAAMGAALREAKAATGVGKDKDKPPEKVKEDWDALDVPNIVTSDEIEREIVNKRAEMDCMETVDPKIVAEYRKMKEQIEELEADIAKRDTDIANRHQQMEKVKNEWLERLGGLVERIDARFSAHFATMGFAGEVGLDCGKFENDFENYGIKIRVKYRDHEPLQELTAHHQSGGERSVATALYMLALQELTTVPFRCVDEINQGMDARNERRVFELLVKTSCRESSAQYFLLTPKLLPGLDYEERMNVLIVNNGPHMCHHSEFDMGKFHQIAARQA